MPSLPTAPVAAASLIAGYAAASASGSRPLGGAVLLLGGAWCARACLARRGAREAIELTGAGVAAFALSHVLARAIGAWPSVLVCASILGALAWARVDARSAPTVA
jgi:hypothetical protein